MSTSTTISGKKSSTNSTTSSGKKSPANSTTSSGKKSPANSGNKSSTPDKSSTSSTTGDGSTDVTPKKGGISNQVYGWALVIVIWIIVGVFIFMYIDVKAKLHTCSTAEGQTCYMFTCPDSYQTATCGSYPYRCDDVEVGKVRCGSDPTTLVSIKSDDGDLCGANFNRCKTGGGNIP